jgi:eukaryotic-like serine/threonine-protein kinase
VLTFLEGRLPDSRRADVENHLGSCASCADLATWAAADTGNGSPDNPSPGARSEGRPFLDQLAPGSRVGQYQILGVVGRGGMGEVYAAYHPDLDRRIALKVVYETGTDTDERHGRLLREARAIARVSHPNVVAVHDAGVVGDLVFIAMELIEGETLDAWLRSAPRTWREILDIFVAAGRGLAAAHAAKIIHRDFKPQNVMIGKDGSVRVMDFGLARLIHEDLGLRADIKDLPEATRRAIMTVTKTGALLGTPAYMAPEQFQRQPADERSDQFSFCVALHEALHGARPMLPHLLSEDGTSVFTVDVSKHYRRAGTPLWVRQLVSRGLNADPAARWGSMRELTRLLERDPARHLRRWAFVAATALVTLGLAIGFGRASRSTATLCRAGPTHLADTWAGAETPSGRSRREAVHGAFLATGLSGVAEIWDRVASRLDRYADAWLAMYRDACEATTVRGDQSSEVLDLRMTCLEDSRSALRALTDVLTTADKQTVNNAVDAVDALPGLDRCADARLLRAVAGPPRDAKTRAQIDDLRRRATVAKALHDTGRNQPAVEQGQRLIAEARAIGYEPLLAEILALTCSFQQSSTFDAASVKTWEEAIWTGLRAKRDDIAAESAAVLGGMVGNYLHRPEEGRHWVDLAVALADRMGGGHEHLRSWILESQAIIANATDPETALRLTRKALELKRKVLQPDDPDIAHSLNNEAEDLHRKGDDAAAVEVGREARRLYTEAYGPNSAYVATVESNIGEYLVALGRSAEALPLFRDARSHWEAQIGADHPFLAYPLTGLGRALIALGRQAEARAPLERALQLREGLDLDPALRAETRFALAQALWYTRESRRALALATMASKEYAQSPAARNAGGEVVAWLARRRGR